MERSIPTSSQSCQLEASFRNIVDEMKKDREKYDQTTTYLETLNGTDLLSWPPEVNDEKRALEVILRDIRSRENLRFQEIVKKAECLERVVGVRDGVGNNEDVGKRGENGVDEVSFDRDCETWSYREGVLKPELSPDERENEFVRLSTDWLALWTVVDDHLEKLKVLTAKVDGEEDLQRRCREALERVSKNDDGGGNGGGNGREIVSGSCSRNNVVEVLKRRSVLVFEHPGPLTRTDKKGEIQIRMMKDWCSFFSQFRPVITRVALMKADGSDDGGYLDLPSDAAKKARRRKDEANELSKLEDKNGLGYMFEKQNGATRFLGAQIPFNAKRKKNDPDWIDKLQLKDLVRKKKEGASVILYRVRITVKLPHGEFDYDTHPFAITTHTSQNPEGSLSVFWERAFGDPTMNPHRQVPWPEFFRNLSEFFASHTGRGLLPVPGSFVREDSYQEDCILEEWNKSREDGVNFYELSAMDFKRGEKTVTKWQWIYSFIPLLHEKYGEVRKERQELLELWREWKIWGFMTKKYEENLFRGQKDGASLLRFRTSQCGEIVCSYLRNRKSESIRTIWFNWNRETLEQKKQFFVDVLVGRVTRGFPGVTSSDTTCLFYPSPNHENYLGRIKLSEMEKELQSRESNRFDDSGYISGHLRDEEVLERVKNLIEKMESKCSISSDVDAAEADFHAAAAGAADSHAAGADDTSLGAVVYIRKDFDDDPSTPTSYACASYVGANIEICDDSEFKRIRFTSGHSDTPFSPDSGFNASYAGSHSSPAWSFAGGISPARSSNDPPLGGGWLSGNNNNYATDSASDMSSMEEVLPKALVDLRFDLDRGSEAVSEKMVSDFSTVGIPSPDPHLLESRDPFMGSFESS